MVILGTLFAIGILAAFAWLTTLETCPAQYMAPRITPAPVRESAADRNVAKAWTRALNAVPGEATAILKARTPCALLIARSAADDLDFPTIEVVEIIRRHIPELIDAHCGIIRTLDPVRRVPAIAEMLRDLDAIAAMAQARLDFIAARRREQMNVQQSHLERCAARMEFA